MEEEKAQDSIQSYFNWPVWTGGYYWDDEVEDVELGYEIEKCEMALEENGEITLDLYPMSHERDIQERELASLKVQEASPFLLENAGEFEGEFYHEGKRILEERPYLFLEFAELPPTRKCILDFANQYGMLKNIKNHLSTRRFSRSIDGIIRPKFNTEYMVPLNPEPTDYAMFNARCERMLTWEEEIQEMKWIVQLWLWLQENDEESLRLVIHWDGQGVQYLLADQEILQQYSTVEEVKKAMDDKSFDYKYERIHPKELLPAPRGDLFHPTKLIIGKTINRKLRDNVYPKLMSLAKENNNLVTYLVPKDLLSAMWLEFSLAASGEKRFKRCEICGEWEDVTSKYATWKVHKSCASRRRYEKYRQKQKEEAERQKQQASKAKKQTPAKKPAIKKASKSPAKKKATTSKGRAKK